MVDVFLSDALPFFFLFFFIFFKFYFIFKLYKIVLVLLNIKMNELFFFLEKSKQTCIDIRVDIE